MTITKIEPIAPGANPFHTDLYHMGTQIQKRAMIMYGSEKDTDKYIIVVDRKTGKRIRIDFDQE